MKKILTSTAVIAAVAAISGSLVACGDKGGNGKTDQQIADEAMTMVRMLYAGKEEETKSSYFVNGIQSVDGKPYNIKWTVSSDFNNFEKYVKVGEMNDEKKVPISISRTSEEIAYTLTATVNVGKASAHEDFKRKIPAGLEIDEDQEQASLDFTNAENNTTINNDTQVWEQDGIKLTNDKDKSPTKVDNYTPGASNAKHVRLYSGSKIKIEYPGLQKLIFTSESSYTANLKTSLETAGLGTVDEDTAKKQYTLTLYAPMNEIEFSAIGQIRLTELTVIGKKGGATDQDRLDGAKAMVNIAKNYWEVGSYDLPTEKIGATVSWKVDGESANVEIADSKLNVKSLPAATGTVKLVATVEYNGLKDTKEITVNLVVLPFTNDGTAAHPYTPAEAKTVAKLLEKGVTHDKEIYVKGYVIAPGTYNEDYKNFEDMYIADEYVAGKETTADDALLIYRASVEATGTKLTTAGFEEGTEVTFKGNLQNFAGNDRQGLANGNCTEVKAVERTPQQSVDAVKADNTLLAKKEYNKQGAEVTLLTEKYGAKLAWAVKDATTLVEIKDGKLIIKSIPATATDVKLEVTITAGEGDDLVTDKKEITISVAPLTLTGDGTLANPYTMADVQKMKEVLDAGKYWGDGSQVYVQGYVVDPGSYSSQYNNYSNIYLVDEYSADLDKNSTGAVQLYRLGLDATYVTKDGDLAKGDFIKVYGFIQNYSGTLQVSYNGSTNPTVVYMEKAGETKTDKQKVDEAKAALTLAESYEAGEVTLPSLQGAATVTWAVTSGTGVTIDGNKMTVDALTEESTVTLTATLKVNDETATKEITIKVLAASTKGTESEPYTVAEAGELLDNLVKDLETPATTTYTVGGTAKLVYVEGYVIAEGTETQYGRNSVTIADSATATNGVVIFGHNYTDDLRQGFVLKKGDKVLVSGYLMNYYSNSTYTKEITSVGSVRPIIKVELTDAQKAERATEAVAATLTVSKEGTVDLGASTVKGVTLAWSTTDATYTVTGNATDGYKLNVAALPTDADATVTLTVTATCGEGTDAITESKTVTVTIAKFVVSVGVELTSTKLGLDKYGNASKEVDGVTFTWTDLGDYGDGIQMKKTSVVSNTTAFSTKIVGLKFVWSSSKDIVAGKSNQLKIEFAASADFSGAQTVYATFTNNKTVEIEIPAGDFTFIRINHNNQGAVYLASITINCAEPDAAPAVTTVAYEAPEAILNDNN